MPRNSGGTYTLPNTAFVPNTVISSASVNQNFSDIASALTLSIATDGSSVLTAPLNLFGGSSSSPSIRFSGSAVNTGIYTSVANQIVVENIGNPTILFNTDNTIVTYGTLFSQGITATGNVSATGALSSDSFLNLRTAAVPATVATYNRIFAQNDVASPTPALKLYIKDELGNTQLLSPLKTGQCRLIAFGGNLALVPYNGNSIPINNVNYQIPTSGVGLLRAGLTDNTFYYIYAYMSSGTMILEASTTGHSPQSGTGIEIKTGDPTRTLVGAAYSDVSSFKDQNGSLLTLSWFNRRRKISTTTFTATRGVASSIVEVNSEIRNRYIAWAEEAYEYEFNAVANGINSATQITTNVRLVVDGSFTRTTHIISSIVNTLNYATVCSRYCSIQEFAENTVHYLTVNAGCGLAGTPITFLAGDSNTALRVYTSG